MSLLISYRFANRATEKFVEHFEGELLDFHNMAGDITFAKIQDLFFSEDGIQPPDDFLRLDHSSIREYFDERAERAYYDRLDALNGGEI